MVAGHFVIHNSGTAVILQQKPAFAINTIPNDNRFRSNAEPLLALTAASCLVLVLTDEIRGVDAAVNIIGAEIGRRRLDRISTSFA